MCHRAKMTPQKKSRIVKTVMKFIVLRASAFLQHRKLHGDVSALGPGTMLEQASGRVGRGDRLTRGWYNCTAPSCDDDVF